MVLQNLKFDLTREISPNNQQDVICFDLKGLGKNRRQEDEDIVSSADGAEAGESSLSRRPTSEQPAEPAEQQEPVEQVVESTATRSGAVEQLFVGNSGKTGGKTLWDQNFREWARGMPICLPKRHYDYVQIALANDTR